MVVPAPEDLNSAEVFSFQREAIISAFDGALAKQRKRNPDLSQKAPIFLRLDDRQKGRSGELELGLKHSAEWSLLVPLARRDVVAVSPEGFVERVKREFAQLNGVDASKVVVEFRIIA